MKSAKSLPHNHTAVIPRSVCVANVSCTGVVSATATLTDAQTTASAARHQWVCVVSINSSSDTTCVWNGWTYKEFPLEIQLDERLADTPVDCVEGRRRTTFDLRALCRFRYTPLYVLKLAIPIYATVLTIVGALIAFPALRSPLAISMLPAAMADNGYHHHHTCAPLLLTILMLIAMLCKVTKPTNKLFILALLSLAVPGNCLNQYSVLEGSPCELKSATKRYTKASWYRDSESALLSPFATISQSSVTYSSPSSRIILASNLSLIFTSVKPSDNGSYFLSIDYREFIKYDLLVSPKIQINLAIQTQPGVNHTCIISATCSPHSAQYRSVIKWQNHTYHSKALFTVFTEQLNNNITCTVSSPLETNSKSLTASQMCVFHNPNDFSPLIIVGVLTLVFIAIWIISMFHTVRVPIFKYELVI